MLVTSALYKQLQNADMRPLSHQFRVSWDKAFDPTITFFELDTSLLNGDDVLSPDGAGDINPWDQYLYQDYSDRIIGMEWQREESVPYSVNLAIADITLNNYDGKFTRGNNSSIDQYLIPRRPIRLLAGFGGQNLPQFVGLTQNAPEVDRKAGTASLHAQDFLSFLFNKPLDQTVMLTDVRTDEVLDYLFQLFDLLPSQYVLDTGFNTIQFVYWEKGKKLGEAIKELMQAELGSLYMDELGTIRFTNRLKPSTTPVASFTDANIIDYSVSSESTITNVVEIKSEVRAVQDLQNVYSVSGALEIPAGVNTGFFFNFEDPVTMIDDIDSYVANSQEDGSGSDVTADIDVVSTELFATAVKVTFTNTGSATVWITALNILGTPARVIRNIYLRVQDDDSVEAFEEQVMTIENNFIQDNDGANSLTLSILNYYKDYSNTIELSVKADYALQLGDNIDVLVDNIDATYTVSKISYVRQAGSVVQRIVGKIYNIPSFFILDESLLNGEDVLAP